MTRVLGLIACTALLAAGLAMASARAAAALLVPESNPGLISLWTDSYPLEFDDLDPGESVYITLDVQLEGADRGDLELEVIRSGELAEMDGGLEIGVERCADPWTAVPTGITADPPPGCASNQRSLVWLDPDDLVDSSTRWAVGPITSTETAHLLVTLTVPGSTALADVQGARASFAFGLFAQGVAVAAPMAAPRLALTGLDVLSLALIGVGAIGAGACASRSRRVGVAS